MYMITYSLRHNDSRFDVELFDTKELALERMGELLELKKNKRIFKLDLYKADLIQEF